MAADVSQLIQAVTLAAVPLCDEAATIRANEISATAPRDTGTLADTWEVSTQGTNDGAVSTLTFSTEYASYQDDPPEEITGNPLLAFEWNGQLVIVHSVKPSQVNRGWFTNPSEDENSWAAAVQTALSGTAII